MPCEASLCASIKTKCSQTRNRQLRLKKPSLITSGEVQCKNVDLNYWWLNLKCVRSVPACLRLTLCEDKGTWRQGDTSEKQGLGLKNPYEFLPIWDVLWFPDPVLTPLKLMTCKAKVLILSSLLDCSLGKLSSTQLHPFRGHQNRLVSPVTSRSYFNWMK